MKKNDLVEIKNLDIKSIESRVRKSREELASLIIDKNMNKLKDLKVLAKKKRDIAQMLTVLNQKLLIEKLETASAKASVVEKGEVKP